MLTVLLGPMERMMQEEIKHNKLEERLLELEVIRLHDIARTVERIFGQPGALSADIRSCADRLSELLKGQ